MYTRRYKDNSDIMWYGQKFEEIFFIMQGEVNLYSRINQQFMILKENSIFGDYAILFRLKSNIIFRTKSMDE